MRSEGVPWMRFYEYWLTPQSFGVQWNAGVRSDHDLLIGTLRAFQQLCAAGCCRLELTNVCVCRQGGAHWVPGQVEHGKNWEYCKLQAHRSNLRAIFGSARSLERSKDR